MPSSIEELSWEIGNIVRTEAAAARRQANLLTAVVHIVGGVGVQSLRLCSNTVLRPRRRATRGIGNCSARCVEEGGREIARDGGCTGEFDRLRDDEALHKTLEGAA
jgi:hypothetical protein